MSYAPNENHAILSDFGPRAIAVDLRKITEYNDTFRTALWTGKHLQVTVMSLRPGEEIGVEMHNNLDQLLYVEAGTGVVKMGQSRDALSHHKSLFEGYCILVPAGTWHNVINMGIHPMKLFSIYAPPQHPHGTVHRTKKDAIATEDHAH